MAKPHWVTIQKIYTILYAWLNNIMPDIIQYELNISIRFMKDFFETESAWPLIEGMAWSWALVRSLLLAWLMGGNRWWLWRRHWRFGWKLWEKTKMFVWSCLFQAPSTNHPSSRHIFRMVAGYIVKCPPNLKTDSCNMYIFTLHSYLHHITSHHIASHNIPSHHITSHHVTLHHIPSHRITSRHIALHHITSNHITSHHITSRHITSHPITSHHITSHHITSRHITSHPITSHHIPSHHITSGHITSHPITSHHFTSHYIISHRIASHHITPRTEQHRPWTVELEVESLLRHLDELILRVIVGVDLHTERRACDHIHRVCSTQTIQSKEIDDTVK